jgi:hypothetical protein
MPVAVGLDATGAATPALPPPTVLRQFRAGKAALRSLPGDDAESKRDISELAEEAKIGLDEPLGLPVGGSRPKGRAHKKLPPAARGGQLAGGGGRKRG